MTDPRKYTAHVTLLLGDCPYTWDEFDCMDWDEKRPLFDEYTLNFSVSFTCPGRLRDDTMGIEVQSLLDEHAGYEVVHQTTPAFDGYV